ncbi:RecB family exonuclease [Amycolatopsis lexingtonensis]|uniref:RecB family exonuclease n=1 Tax=Amycolatopsis lexingtonensis TaxID=218822 RepID=UPI003F6EC38E
MAKKPRSVSQYNQYKKCPKAYELERIHKAWARPAAWLPQGTAVHYAAEVWEESGRAMSLADAQAAYVRKYAEEVSRYCAETPNWEYWFRSGPYAGEVDANRRFEIGFGQVEAYINYYQHIAPHETVWLTPDGRPAIELRFKIDLDGVEVIGFIDQVVNVRDKVERPRTASGALSKSKKALAEYAEALEASPLRPRPRDVKTGNRPGDDFQLGVYDVAIEDLFGIKADVGDYWMARQGGPTDDYDLTAWTRERVTEEFHWLDEKVEAEEFPALPEPDKCRFCSVANACPFSAA